MEFDQFNTAADWPTDPIALFREWFDNVKANDDVCEPEVMTLCSSTADGRPSARIVFLRGLDHGFCFYTNYESRKGCELIANPRAALVFYWPEPYLQVRVEGSVEKLTTEESDAYFNSRERAKRLSALVSRQSRPIDSWSSLRAASDRLTESDSAATRPDHWGGLRILPERMEFWAGSRDRMHLRCEYTAAGDEWTRELLAP
jgi:pyridoxamine 5'-phosphate oxidase